MEVKISNNTKMPYKTLDHLDSNIEFDTEKILSAADIIAMMPSSETIEENGIEGGLRDGELQMFWEGATWLKGHLQRQLLTRNKISRNETNGK